MVIQCPEGRLLLALNVLPIMIKLLGSKNAAGLGTEKIFFSKLDKIREINDEEIRTSHNLGVL